MVYSTKLWCVLLAHVQIRVSSLTCIDLNYICVAAVRKEISDETDRETGRTKQISSVPIHLSIYSPNGKNSHMRIFCSCTNDVFNSLLNDISGSIFLFIKKVAMV